MADALAEDRRGSGTVDCCAEDNGCVGGAGVVDPAGRVDLEREQDQPRGEGEEQPAEGAEDAVAC